MITEKFLLEQGFVDSGEKHAFSIVWRKPYGSGFFNFVIGDYLKTNPNIGVLGIYYAEEEIPATPPDLIDKEEWTVEDSIRADNYTIKCDHTLTNIAWYLDDEERFKRLIDDISFKR